MTEVTSVRVSIIKSRKKSKNLATILAIFFGGVGLHKFYLDKTKVGIFYLVFCWTFIPMIIGFFEGIGYLRMAEEFFQNNKHKW